MDGPRGFKTKWNKWETERRVLLFICEIKKQNKWAKQQNKTDTDIKKRLVVARREWVTRWIKKVKMIKRYRLSVCQNK